MPAVLIALALMALFAALYAYDRRYGQRIRASWQAVAAELGLSWQPPVGEGGPGRISGLLGGCSVLVQRVETVTAGRQRRRSALTQLSVKQRRPLGLGLLVVSRGMVGMDPIRAETAPADRRVDLSDLPGSAGLLVCASDRVRARRLLESGLLPALAQAARDTGGLAMDDEEIRCFQQGISEDVGRMVATLRAQVALAAALDAARGG
jgi:hypothetical protein